MEQLLNELIKYFLEEADHPIIDIPKNYVNKREFLRGLLNVREAKQLPIEIINKENDLLQAELKEKNVIDINSFENKFSLWQGDITLIKCDGIVNPSTSNLLGCFKPNHNCVSNKIHTYAGISLRLKCREITKGQEIETCKVIMTDGYNLPCNYIIHVVKPEINELNEDIINQIKKTYINVLDMAKKNNIKTICIPNINTIGSLKEEVADITINTIKEYLENDSFFEKVVFNIFTLDDYNIYKKYF